MLKVPPMFRKPALSYGAVTVALACHAAAVYLYYASNTGGVQPGEEQLQLFALAATSLALAVSMFASRTRSFYWLLLAARVTLFLLLGFRFRLTIDVRALLTTSLAVEIGVYDDFPRNVALQALLFLALLAAFGIPPAPGIPESARVLVQGLLLPAVCGGATSLVTLYRERLLQEQDHSRRLDEAVSRLTESNSRIQQIAFRAQEQSRVSERHRLAREIHDTVGYTLTNLIMMMEAATDLVLQEDPRDLESIMEAAREQAKSGLEETRRALRVLREETDPPLQGLRAVAQLVGTFETAGTVRVQVHYGNAPLSCGDAIDSVLYHLVQEGLTNALRHGKATWIRISFWVKDRALTVTVSDNGVGAADLKEGIGFAGMRERLELVGGSLRAQNTPDGFQVAVTVPLAGRTE